MEQINISKRTIDLENVFRSKNPALAKIIPGFIFRRLRKIIHEDEINSFVYNNKNVIGLDFVDATLNLFGAKVNSLQIENLPLTERALIASNHPLGGLDGLALMHAVGKIRRDIVFPVNDLLLFLPNLKPLFIPINKHGSNAENFKIMDDTFSSDKIILYFPAGLVSRKQNKIIRDLEWKKTFIAKAKQYKRDIIPVYIDGQNSNKFYKLANNRKKFGIKANIEMLYLPDEMFKYNNRTINITFGKPIPFKTFDKRFNYMEWAAKIKNYVYAIGDGYQDPFDPDKF